MGKELKRLEAEARTASLAGDTAVFERIASEDFLSIDPTGRIRDKAETVRHRKSGEMKFHSIEAGDEQVRVYENTAIVTGSALIRGEYRGGHTGGRYRYTRVYVKQGGAWRIVSSQSTAIGE